MLFRKNMAKSCAYCAHAARIDEDTLLCSKRGFVSVFQQCRRFKYDPLRRIPLKMKAQNFSKYSPEDFLL